MNASLADALAFALETGAIDVQDVRNLADQAIATAATVSDNLLDLAWNSNRAESLSILHAMGEGSNKPEAARLMLGYLEKALVAKTLSVGGTAKAVARMASLAYVPTPDVENAMYFFAEDLAPADIGELSAGHAAKVEEDLRAFLQQNAA
jgi:hypothetical protein